MPRHRKPAFLSALIQPLASSCSRFSSPSRSLFSLSRCFSPFPKRIRIFGCPRARIFKLFPTRPPVFSRIIFLAACAVVFTVFFLSPWIRCRHDQSTLLPFDAGQPCTRTRFDLFAETCFSLAPGEKSGRRLPPAPLPPPFLLIRRPPCA